MATEIAALGLKVENQGVDKAAESLDRLAESAGKAEKAATGLGRKSRTAGDQATKANQDVARSADRMSKSYDDAGKSILRAARSVASLVGAAVGIGAAINTIAGFEHSMASVAAITGASTAELERMRDAAKELGATTEFSASQAADGLRFLGMAGFSAAESLESIPAVLNLATASTMGLAEAADIATNIMSGFGMAASEAASVADVLAAASSSSNTSVQQLGGAMSTVAPIASALNINLSDTAAAIGIMSDAGIQGERAGTALRGVLASLAGPTTAAQKTLKSLGLTVADVNPATNELSDIFAKLHTAGLSTADAMTIFGREAASGALVLVGAAQQLGEFGEQLSNADGAAQKMADTMRDSLKGDILGVQSAIEGAVIAMGEAGFTRVLRAVVQWLTEAIRAATGFINTIGSLAGAIATKLQPVISFLEPVLSAIARNADIALLAMAGFYSGRLIGGVLILTKAIGVGLVGALRALVVANPIGLFIGAIVTAGYAIYKFRYDIAQAIGVDVIDVVRKAANYLIGSFVAAYEDIKFVWSNFGDIIGGGTIGGVNVAIRAINRLIQGALSGINTLVDAVNKIPGMDIGRIGQSVGINEIVNPYAERLTASIEERNKRITEALSRDYIGSGADAISGLVDSVPGVASIVLPGSGGSGGSGGGSGAASKESLNAIKQNQQAIEGLAQSLYLAGLEGEALAVAQARMSLNEYATPEQIARVDELAKAIHSAQEEMRRRQQFGTGTDADSFILGETSPLSGGQFDNQIARYEAEAEAERLRYEQQLERLIEARELQIETNRTYDELEAEAAQQHADRLAQIERAKSDLILTSTGDMFAAIAGAMKKSQGEQSTIYRAMFAAAKGFAVASATINAYDAISKAWNSAPFPANLLAVAATAPQVMAVVSAISGTGLTGMAHDGIDSVPKTGTWLLEQGERVTTAQTSARMDSVLERIDSRMRSGRSSDRLTGSTEPKVTVNVHNAPEGTVVEQRTQDDEHIIDVVLGDLMNGGRVSEYGENQLAWNRQGR